MNAATRLSHIDARGRAKMVDVSAKGEGLRLARASGRVFMRPDTLERICSGGMEKGDVLATARLAGIMAAKRTAEAIPLCHPLALTAIDVQLAPITEEEKSGIEVIAAVRCKGPTGVEMEALHAVAVACLTVYDMAKAMDRGMEIGAIRLEHKSGGKSGEWNRAQRADEQGG